MPRVLVLAADPADTALAAQRLRESGPGTAVLEVLEVRTAVQYAEALASSVAPALVVVESALPWADATAVMLQLATHWPECKAVLLATGDCSVPANRPLGMAVHAVVGLLVAVPDRQPLPEEPIPPVPAMEREASTRDVVRIGSTMLGSLTGTSVGAAAYYPVLYDDPTEGRQAIYVEQAPGVAMDIGGQG